MNYYMPYFNMVPNVIPSTIGKSTSKGLFSRLIGGLNWSSILNNTQKTLGIVNQAIPMVKQISPVMKNAKTMFRVMNEFKKVDIPTTSNSETTNITTNNLDESRTIVVENKVYDGGPTFFIN